MYMRLRTVFFIVVTPLSSLVSCTAPPPAAAPPPPPPPTSAPPLLRRNKQPARSKNHALHSCNDCCGRPRGARPAARAFFLLAQRAAKKEIIARSSAPGRPQAEERGRRVAVRLPGCALGGGGGGRAPRAASSRRQKMQPVVGKYCTVGGCLAPARPFFTTAPTTSERARSKASGCVRSNAS